jgi:hypothetical protein
MFKKEGERKRKMERKRREADEGAARPLKPYLVGMLPLRNAA